MRKTLNHLLPLLLPAAIFITACSKKEEDTKPPEVSITSIFPASAGGGDTVTAHGKNLPTDIASISITVNNKVARIITATADSIQAVVPELSGSGKVILTAGSETVEGPVLGYQYQAIVTTIAGNGSIGNSNGTGSNASFNCPWGIAADADNNLFIADCYNRLIRKIAVADDYVSSYSIPTYVDSPNFYSPYNLAIHPLTNNLYVTDFNAHLMRMDPAGNTKIIYMAAQPLAGIAISPDGNDLFVGNNTDGTITKMNIDGSNATIFTNGLTTPRNIFFNSAGKMFVAAYPGPVYELSTSGAPGVAASSPDFGGWEATTDTSGNFFLADHFSNCIRMIEKNGNTFILAGSGDPVDTDGTGLEASFNGPQGITRDKEGTIYVTTYNYDTGGGNKVRKIVVR